MDTNPYPVASLASVHSPEALAGQVAIVAEVSSLGPVGMVSSIRAVGTLGLRPLRVGATPVPHAEILEHTRPALAEHGIDLQIEIFETFDEPNDLLVSKHLHANFFQYLPFLNDFNRRTGGQLTPVVPVHIEPFGLYSAWFADLDALPDYAEVVLPSDPVNVDRSLVMLHDLGLIDCAPGPRELATVTAIRANPRHLVFKELTSWLLGDVREDFDAVFLFGNQAMEWGVDVGSALCRDQGNPAYAEYLVARPDNCDHADVLALADALQCDATRNFITTMYDGQVVPAF